MGFQRTFIAQRTDELTDDVKALALAVNSLAMHTGQVLQESWTAGFLQWLAAIAAVYLLILDRTNWRTNFLTALLIPYLYINLPDLIFNWLWGSFGKVIAFIAVVLKLFFPRHFPDVLDLPAALILLVVVSPYFLAYGSAVGRYSALAIFISLAIGAYLLYEHINAAGGFRKAFAEKKGIPVTVGVILLVAAPFVQLFPFFGVF